jgi:hypothetical protein
MATPIPRQRNRCHYIAERGFDLGGRPRPLCLQGGGVPQPEAIANITDLLDSRKGRLYLYPPTHLTNFGSAVLAIGFPQSRNQILAEYLPQAFLPRDAGVYSAAVTLGFR